MPMPSEAVPDLGRRRRFNNRERMLAIIIASLLFMTTVLVLSFVLPDDRIDPGAAARNLPVSWAHPFGTDWLGRDMFTRAMKGMRLSMAIGLVTAGISSVMAVFLGALSALGGRVADQIVSWLIDLFIGMPHLVFMLLLAFVVGGGMTGVIVGVGLTHWTSLARLVRAEILKVKGENYIVISRRMGMGPVRVFFSHVLPHVLPQVMVGFLLLFPHVILHEAGLTFLGFGLSPQVPALGIILSEGMNNVSSGHWWLILLPTVLLVAMAKSFDGIGERLKTMFSPTTAHD